MKRTVAHDIGEPATPCKGHEGDGQVMYGGVPLVDMGHLVGQCRPQLVVVEAVKYASCQDRSSPSFLA